MSIFNFISAFTSESSDGEKSFPGIDWRCDVCDALLNSQSGFTDSEGSWECTECGYVNSITEDDIIMPPSGSTFDSLPSEEGCRACDNPAYPMCKDSCPMFD